MTFADKLRELRQAGGMTQAALSEASGIPLPTIRDYEQGKREPLLSNAQRLARALGASLDTFPAPDESGTRDTPRPRGRKAGASPPAGPPRLARRPRGK
jgi:transcriptional regulator with XRE-family HTH domain